MFKCYLYIISTITMCVIVVYRKYIFTVMLLITVYLAQETLNDIRF